MKKEKWLKTVVPEKRPERKALFTLRLDPQVVAWYRKQKPYNPMVEAILRAYMEAHK
ncbi:MAG: BrnA antitoxin family protein [Burkholderiales bacterium]